ncbi:MAG: aminotransferase class I/II-fold pyridoxal phosphate-dependent enzyme [Acidobacteriia bacterium]|nr:aminotransferase class I/II-fold pyridoxal phosphate-dependent enzyme [Terriglobia bacterium]
MKFDTFELERFQSTWENQVEINISESGVHPLTVDELFALAGQVNAPRVSRRNFPAPLSGTRLGYSQTDGTLVLRQKIARLYRGATTDHVEVTNGGSEANFVTLWRLVERGDEIVVMMPNYMQVWGLGRAFHGRVKEWWLHPVKGTTSPRWVPQGPELKKLVTKKTRLIAVCNPNNPTGAVLKRNFMEEVIARARWADAWVLADEVYQGAELSGAITPSFWSIGDKAPYKKLIVSNSLSKAYGLPGLRIGWLVGSPEAIAHSWAAHDYTSIGPGALNDALAAIALTPAVRKSILERTRNVLRSQWPILEDWAEQNGDTFELIKPQAGAIALLRYKFKMNSTQFAEHLRRQKSVLIVPGDHFHLDGYLRVGFGGHLKELKEGLKRLSQVAARLHGG